MPLLSWSGVVLLVFRFVRCFIVVVLLNAILMLVCLNRLVILCICGL
jgi:hypothetical protein